MTPSKAAYDSLIDANGHVTPFVQDCLKKSSVTVPSLILKDVVKATQRDWLLAGERWKVQNPRLTAQMAREILRLGREALGEDSIMPQKKRYAGILFLGGIADWVQSRLLFIHSLIGNIKFHKLYLLTGKRSLEPFEKAEFPFLQNMDDEGPMVRAFVEQILPEIPADKFIYVYSEPPPDNTRATTQSTVMEFMKYKPGAGLYLAISNGYYIPYQELVIQNYLDKFYPESNISIEAVGSGDPDAFQEESDEQAINNASIFLDNISWILYNLDVKRNLTNT